MDQAPRVTASRPLLVGQPNRFWLGWLFLVLTVLLVWLPQLGPNFQGLAHPPAGTEGALRDAGLTASAHAWYHVCLDLLFGLGTIVVAGFIMKHHRRDPLAASAAFVLTVWGPWNGLVVEAMSMGQWWARPFCGFAWVALGWLIVRSRNSYVTDSSLVARQRIRWLWYGAATSFLAMVVTIVGVGSGLTLGDDQIDRHMTSHLLLVIGASLFPASLAAAWLLRVVPDPDTLIRRSLVYGALTSIVVAITITFVLVPAYFYYELGPVYLLFVVSAWAIVGVHLSQYLQRLVNRLLYGQRDEPMTILRDLGDRLELGSPETVLSTIVETVAATLKVPGVAIRDADDERNLASIGQFNLESVSVPVVHQSQQVGHLVVSTRARDEPLHERDHEVLRLVARQAGPTVRAVQLNQELRRSRQQILSGREEERRRIRRDLHDGLGPALAAIAMQADTARAVVDEDPEAARELLVAVTKQAEDVVHEVRRLVYDLRPPALDELGLVGAIERLARQTSSSSLVVRVTAPDSLPALGAAIEVAMYRIVAEALTNVARHSHATECLIHIGRGGSPSNHLSVTIEDNGVGMSGQSLPGIGLRSMHDRASEVGGTIAFEPGATAGTRIVVVVPLEPN